MVEAQLSFGLPNNHSAPQNYKISIGDVCRQPKRTFHLDGKIGIVRVLLPTSQVLGLWHRIGKTDLQESNHEFISSSSLNGGVIIG